jgi:hypothetical protein
MEDDVVVFPELSSNTLLTWREAAHIFEFMDYLLGHKCGFVIVNVMTYQGKWAAENGSIDNASNSSALR